MLQAQLSPPQPRKNTNVKTQSTPGLESVPTRTPQATPAVNNSNYALTSVQVNISTGNDNKESLSNVSIELALRNSNYQVFAQNNLTNEMRINSTTLIGLERSALYTNGYHPNAIPTIYYTTATGNQSIMLSDLEKYGLALRIIYKPNFFADAWRIERVDLSLEFRDASGSLHPTAGKKTISFTNAATFLDNFDKRILICTADTYFNPLTAFVTKDFTKRW